MFSKLFKSEGGFTLVELLVTIGILAVLFGIVTLTLQGVGSDAQDDVCDAELSIVQSAIDIWIAANPSLTLTADTNTQVGPGSGHQFSGYLRGTSVGDYTWDASGTVSDAGCPSDG
jgi:prepilin-type N-terminal cleavage/methylation domain-containing protein